MRKPSSSTGPKDFAGRAVAPQVTVSSDAITTVPVRSLAHVTIASK